MILLRCEATAFIIKIMPSAISLLPQTNKTLINTLRTI